MYDHTLSHRVTCPAAINQDVIAATQDLYDRHKAEYGWSDRPLSIE